VKFRSELLLGAGVVAAAACGGSVSTGNGKPPVAVTASSVGGLVGIATQFDGSASYDPDGTVVSWAWDFGDGHTGSGKSPQHVYTVASSYAASLTVKDNSGNSDQKAIAVTVDPLSAIDGTWSLTTNPTVTNCSNGNYAVAFPAPALAVSVSGGTISAVPSGSQMHLNGSFDVSGKLLISATTTSSSYSCLNGSSMPAHLTQHEEALTATFGGASFLGGRYSLILDWDYPLCNCAKIFDVTGSK